MIANLKQVRDIQQNMMEKLFNPKLHLGTQSKLELKQPKGDAATLKIQYIGFKSFIQSKYISPFSITFELQLRIAKLQSRTRLIIKVETYWQLVSNINLGQSHGNESITSKNVYNADK